jgi:hypothetical protein
MVNFLKVHCQEILEHLTGLSQIPVLRSRITMLRLRQEK